MKKKQVLIIILLTIALLLSLGVVVINSSFGDISSGPDNPGLSAGGGGGEVNLVVNKPFGGTEG